MNNNRIIYIIIVIFLTIAAFFTNDNNKKVQCLDKYLESKKNTMVCSKLKLELNDTIMKWANLYQYERIKVLVNDNWKISERILLNSENNLAILFLLQKDDIVNKYSKLDYIHLVFANKENGRWSFYYQSMETIVVPRKVDENGKYLSSSFEQLSLIAINEYIDTYYINNSCNINNSFFEAWDLNFLKNQHHKLKGYY